MTDLVLQSPRLSADAIDAFAVACLAQQVLRREAHGTVVAARLCRIVNDEHTPAVIGALSGYWKCDAALVAPKMRAADYRALVLDMDSTLITIESIDELARLAGKGEAVAAITEAAMRGEIADYAQSLRQRVALLAGLEESVVEQVRAERLRLSPGAPALCAGARARGWKTLLVSGGFTLIAQAVQEALGIDACCANRLVTQGGRLTGEVLGPAENDGRIIDAAGKARALQRHCQAWGCAPKAAIAVGDGANDLQMMALAGLSIAYRAKPRVREQADCALDHAGLDGVLALFADDW